MLKAAFDPHPHSHHPPDAISAIAIGSSPGMKGVDPLDHDPGRSLSSISPIRSFRTESTKPPTSSSPAIASFLKAPSMSWSSIRASAAPGGRLPSKVRGTFFWARTTVCSPTYFTTNSRLKCARSTSRSFGVNRRVTPSTGGIFLPRLLPGSPSTNRLSPTGRLSKTTGGVPSLSHIGNTPPWSARLSTWIGSGI